MRAAADAATCLSSLPRSIRKGGRPNAAARSLRSREAVCPVSDAASSSHTAVQGVSAGTRLLQTG